MESFERRFDLPGTEINKLGNKFQEIADKFVHTFTYDKDKYKKIKQLIRDYDYPFAKHFYYTEDEYINCVF